LYSQDGYAIIRSRFDNEDVAMEILALLFVILGISVIRYTTKSSSNHVQGQAHAGKTRTSHHDYSLTGGPFISSTMGDTGWHANQAHRLQRFYEESDSQ
jgi:hypothetical protein